MPEHLLRLNLSKLFSRGLWRSENGLSTSFEELRSSFITPSYPRFRLRFSNHSVYSFIKTAILKMASALMHSYSTNNQ